MNNPLAFSWGFRVGIIMTSQFLFAVFRLLLPNLVARGSVRRM